MTPNQLEAWFRKADIGSRVMYWAAPTFGSPPPQVHHTARQLHAEGRVMLYQAPGGAHYALKISSRAKRFIDRWSALTPTPPMGPWGLYASGRGDKPNLEPGA